MSRLPSGRIRMGKRAEEAAPEVEATPSVSEGRLREALLAAVEAVVVGEVRRPSLAASARTAALAVLHRAGVGGARVQASLEGANLRLVVQIPRGPARVQTISLTVAGL